jgi:uncharacterized protein (DUF736 family)
MAAPGDSRKTSRQVRSFTANANGSFSGVVRALALGARAIRVRPDEKTGERGPDYRVFAGQTDLGAAWRKIGAGDNAALSESWPTSAASRSTPRW